MPTKTKFEHGQFSWVELGTTDPAAAKKFYGGLFGWTFEDMPAGPDMIYTMNKLGNHRTSALYKMGKEMQGVPPHWLSYFTVADCEATVQKAQSLGGTVMMPKTKIPQGTFAVLADPAGAAFAVIQPA